MSVGPLFNADDERVTRLIRTTRMRVVGGVSTVLVAYLGGRSIITHSAAGVASLVVFAVVVAALVVSDRPTLRPVPILLLGGVSRGTRVRRRRGCAQPPNRVAVPDLGGAGPADAGAGGAGRPPRADTVRALTVAHRRPASRARRRRAWQPPIPQTAD